VHTHTLTHPGDGNVIGMQAVRLRRVIVVPI